MVLSSCTMKGEFEDISRAELFFIKPSSDSFSNDPAYDFKIRLETDNRDIRADQATLLVFEGAGCRPENLIGRTSMTGTGATAGAAPPSSLMDGQTYSARVSLIRNGKTFQSVCSGSVGIDFQKPEPVGVTFPLTDASSSAKEVHAVWTTAVDNGLSGLTEAPYRVRLYGEPLCAGAVLKTVDVPSLQHKFKDLVHGVQYSVQISSLDKAGNESVSTCSAYTEIDVNVPGFSFSDPTSAEGYSRTETPRIQIRNDSPAAFWCFTSQVDFVPTSLLDDCPGGPGSFRGWFSSRPETLPVGAGEGLKTYELWIARADGTLISSNRSFASIVLDQIPPGNFAVTGVGGGTDGTFDAWLTSSGPPELRWTASEGAVDYAVEIRTASGDVLCSAGGVTEPGLVMDGCPALYDGAAYEAQVVAFDVARNSTSSAVFDLTVDRDPPGGFSIVGVTGFGDEIPDAFVGIGAPSINYAVSAGSTDYEIQVQDMNDVAVCTVGVKIGQSGFFDYDGEPGAACAGLIHGGTYRVYLTAFDEGRNSTPASNNGFEFQVDTVAPMLSIDSGPPPVTAETGAEIAFTAADALSGFAFATCRLDGGAVEECASPKTYANLSEGPHRVDVTAYDQSGNSVLRSHVWRVDVSNPILTIDSGPSEMTNVLPVSIAFHADDASGIESYACRIDGEEILPCLSPVTFFAAEGPHTVVLRATDELGFYDEKTVTFTVDITPPELVLTAAPDNPSHNTSRGTVSFAVSDAAAFTVRCRVDGGPEETCASPAAFEGLAAGSHAVTIEATDAAGNTASETVDWVIYTYSWSVGDFGECSAAQPNWDLGAWSSCSAAQPSFAYSAWGACSAVCGGGVQYRTETCPVIEGSQTRSVSCPIVNGTQVRDVRCRRNDDVTAADGFCEAASKPPSAQSCARGGSADCAGPVPESSQVCARGGGADCSAPQPTSQSCNPQACLTWHVITFPQWTNGTYVGLYCSSSLGYTPVHGTVCTSNGYRCADRIGAGGMQATCQY